MKRVLLLKSAFKSRKFLTHRNGTPRAKLRILLVFFRLHNILCLYLKFNTIFGILWRVMDLELCPI